MYPLIRMAKAWAMARKAKPLPVLGEHVSHHMCLPWDLDIWHELNNGRTLTIYDLGRIPLVMRTGLWATVRRHGWGLTMAGATVRYRRRIRVFERITMRSRAVYWDARFLYLEQSMWTAGGECANHVVYRAAFTGPGGIVPPAQVMAAQGHTRPSPPAPPFVAAWIEAETLRPWPPVTAAG
ncbi:MAG: thioesterase family protein [Roseivivax sp.]|nr:thioesterase family protein [Roseivivax sp.]